MNVYDRSTGVMAVRDAALVAFRRSMEANAVTLSGLCLGQFLANLLRRTEVGCSLGERLGFRVWAYPLDGRIMALELMGFLIPVALFFLPLWWFAPRWAMDLVTQRIEARRRLGKVDGTLSGVFIALAFSVSLPLGFACFLFAADLFLR